MATASYAGRSITSFSDRADDRRVGFPFNQRWLMTGWNVLYGGPSPASAAEVAPGAPGRGAYLANALEHCSTCHTPRSALMG